VTCVIFYIIVIWAKEFPIWKYAPLTAPH